MSAGTLKAKTRIPARKERTVRVVEHQPEEAVDIAQNKPLVFLVLPVHGFLVDVSLLPELFRASGNAKQ
jgi:hypothetical protein